MEFRYSMAWIPTREGKPGMWSVGDPGTRKSAMHSLSIYTKCSTGAERNASFQMRAPRFVEYFKVRTTSLEVKSQRRGPELAFDVGVLGERRLRPSSRWSPTPPTAQLDRSAGLVLCQCHARDPWSCPAADVVQLRVSATHSTSTLRRIQP